MMINYSECTKDQLIEAVEALAYQVIQHEHPTWFSIPEVEVVQLLKCECLPVTLEFEEVG